MRIGILSDMHDRIIPHLFRALAGVDEILHAGDFCTADTLAEIEAIAPVTAVHGNMDERALFERFPEERRLERGGFMIALLHGHSLRRGRLEDFVARYRESAPDLVIFGHSHEPLSEAVGGTRYFNPGTAGGIGRSPTAGILSIEDGGLAIRHVDLAV
ncbi:metallophosphoesterase family protein [soil metagenome]